jgi:superoxide reductase
MVKVGEKYKCSVCGNLVEVKEVGGGTLVCCGKPMVLQATDDGINPTGDEKKHVPVIEIKGEKEIYVKIGEIEHPMTADHYIQWIEINVDGAMYVKSLNQWDKPETTFRIPIGRKIIARAKCNIHGVWKTVYSGQ